MQCWHELSKIYSAIHHNVIDSIPQLEARHHLHRLPTPEEVEGAVNQINTGKALGLDRISVELLQTGSKNILHAVYDFIVTNWRGIPIPQGWVDGILVSLNKGKEEKFICNHYGGIHQKSVSETPTQQIDRKYLP